MKTKFLLVYVALFVILGVLAPPKLFALVADPLREIYRSPSSQFRSGQAPESALQKHIMQSKKQISVAIKSDSKMAWVKETDLWRVEELSSFPIDASLAMVIEDTPFYVQNQKTNQWTVEYRLRATNRIRWTQIGPEWSQVRFQIGQGSTAKTLTGSVQTKHLLLPIDFATYFQVKGESSWRALKLRKEDMILSQEGIFIPLKQIQKIKVSKEYAVTKHQINNPITGARLFFALHKVMMTEQKMVVWKRSLLADHGAVWWQTTKSENVIEPNKIQIPNSVLRKRMVSDLAVSPVDSKRAIASSQGVYVTKDRTTWERLDAFSNENHPVAITKEGALIVGDKISRDNGLTFQPFIKWDEILKLATIKNRGQTPRFLKIEKIDLPTQSLNEVILEIKTGRAQNLKYRTSLNHFN